MIKVLNNPFAPKKYQADTPSWNLGMTNPEPSRPTNIDNGNYQYNYTYTRPSNLSNTLNFQPSSSSG